MAVAHHHRTSISKKQANSYQYGVS
ncbi:hypothetical protein Gorai_001958, partial [Gossypium raimondii]|nr:hypothetical protein [Gossypium raimondii]